MSLEFTFTCPLASGLHARPAAQLADLANVFASDCLLTNLRNKLEANLKSPLAIVAANIRSGDTCSIRIAGGDQESALASLRRFVAEDIPKSDEPLIRPPTEDQHRVVPRVIQTAGVDCCFGHVVHRGIAQGRVVFVEAMAPLTQVNLHGAHKPGMERQRVQNALASVQLHLRSMLALPGSAAQKAIVKAQLSLAADISLADKMEEQISQGNSAGQAVLEAGKFFLDVFRQSESAYIRERALDLQDVLQQLLKEIFGPEFNAAAVKLQEPSIAVAEMLSPQQLLSLDRTWLKAVVLQSASTTAHVVILAHSLGIPTLVGVKDALRKLARGQDAVVDANRGLVVPANSAAVLEFYAREADLVERRRNALLQGTATPFATADNRKMEVAANVATAEELGPAFEQGTEGIGLFRTEMLFLGREVAPGEDGQFVIYQQAARLAAGRPVIIRTLDVGADKPAPQLHLPHENNPFLGYRGVRIYPAFRDVIRAQVRAILRASAFGRVWMMVPMVSSFQEVLWVKALVAELKNELKAEGIAFDPALPLGIMVETPSVAFMLDSLCAELDFFSLGTNDLCQYFFAAERGNDRVAGLAQVRHPAFLRFLRQIVDEVHKAGKWIGMCGDMAADLRNLPLLVGLSLNEISVPASEIPELKQQLRRLAAHACDQLLSRATACRHPEEVEKLLGDHQKLEGAPSLLSPELVVIGDDSKNKEAAIRAMVEKFYIAGRAEDPQFIEQAVWDREALSSTGLGYGFAIPHCKTDAVAADSVGVLKFKQPIDWSSLDEQPVRMMILLAVRESQTSARHLQILSRLARKLMDEEFRARLLALDQAEAIAAFLSQELNDLPG